MEIDLILLPLQLETEPSLDILIPIVLFSTLQYKFFFPRAYTITLNASFETLETVEWHLCGVSSLNVVQDMNDTMCVKTTNAFSLPTNKNSCNGKFKYIWEHLLNI